MEQFKTGTTEDFMKSMTLLISSFCVQCRVLFQNRKYINFDINDKSKTSNKVLKLISVLKKKTKRILETR